MNPITPERFIERLKEKRSLNLYNTKKQKMIEYYGIEKDLDGSFIVHSRDYGGRTHKIDYLYESKPETPLEGLEGLDEIINDLRKHFGTRYTCKWDAWRDKYESQLKELK